MIIAGEITLQDAKVIAFFDTDSGALIRLENKITNWKIERRPELGVSFRLFVPLPQHHYNFVLGQKQHAAEVKKVSNNKVEIKWSNLLSEFGGILPITITAEITLNDRVLTFNSKIENNSNLTIETIDYPYFGDFNPPSKNVSMHVRTMRYDNLLSDEIYPHFRNEKGYWGDFYPIKSFSASYSLFCLVQSENQGLYIEMKDPDPSYLLEYTFELHPGFESSVTNRIPAADVIPGKSLFSSGSTDSVSVHLEFRTCHFIFAHPHSTVDLSPVEVQCYNGNWHSGVDLYKEWRSTWYVQPYIPQRATEIHSWQQLQINSPVQNYGVKYTQLIKYGEECAKNGVKAIQLVGWNKGGQDGGNPSMDTDPGLGSWQQLHDAIVKIQSMGVKVILFDKFPWADKTTDWYKEKLFKYETADPYGIPYQTGGYSYYTPTQLAGISTHRFAVMDLLDPEYRNIAVNEFRKALALGASGFLYDEVCVQPPNHAYNFNKGHGYIPPGYIYSGAELLGKQLHAAADSVDKNFLFCGEGPQDWLTQYYPFSYFRISASSIPVERYIDPQAPLMVAANGFDDREMINLCLMYRYIIEYEPYNFKGKLSDFPLTLSYGKKVDSLRIRYKEYLWDADFQDTIGADVTADGPVKYSVFVNKKGKRAVVVVNMDSNKEIDAEVKIPKHGSLAVVTHEYPDEQSTNGMLKILPRSAAVVLEQ